MPVYSHSGVFCRTEQFNAVFRAIKKHPKVLSYQCL
nr:MAG TPA: hypothetical protein [Caudoviricetes sp.]